MAIHHMSLAKFTAFKDLDIEFHPCMNVLVGGNGTGKTHLMKLLYSACSITTPSGKSGKEWMDKIISVFLPSGNQAHRLIHRARGRHACTVDIARDDATLGLRFTSTWKKRGNETIEGLPEWLETPVKSVYIPVKEMLANAPGFAALYDTRELHFEEIYRDIITLASIPVTRGPASKTRKELQQILEKTMDGTVVQNNSGEFFLKDSQGDLEFTLLSEGMRKLALLLVLIKNEVLSSGTVLFWDEPEANLNPIQTQMVVNVMEKLCSLGVQIFVATHDYMTAKEIDMRFGDADKVRYFSFFRDKKSSVRYVSALRFEGLERNDILDSYSRQFDRYLQQSLSE